MSQKEATKSETQKKSSSSILSHLDPEFTPLQFEELNDLRRRIVANEEVSDEELKLSIETYLFHDREHAVKGKQSTGRKSRSAPKLDPDVNFDDLLKSPVNPADK